MQDFALDYRTSPLTNDAGCRLMEKAKVCISRNFSVLTIVSDMAIKPNEGLLNDPLGSHNPQSLLLPSTQFDTQTISTRERLSPTNNTSAESIDCENCCQPCGDLCSRVIRSVRSGCSRVEQDLDPWNILVHLFPVFQWLPRYQWASDFVYDLTAGITVAVMQIPQGMRELNHDRKSKGCNVILQYVHL